MVLVDLMGTSCTGICLEHQLSIFWLTRRGMDNLRLVEYVYDLCSCVLLFIMNHSINIIVLNYLPTSKYTIRLLFKYLSFHMNYENINHIMKSFNTYRLKKMDKMIIFIITISFICIIAEGR